MTRFRTWLPLFGFVALLAISQLGCALLGGGTKTPPMFGTWNYTMESTSQGGFTGVMVLHQEEDGSYSGRISAVEAGIDDMIDIQTMEIDGSVFMLHGSVAGNEFRLNGTVDGDMMSGTNDVVGLGMFTFSATRAEDDSE